MHSGNDVNMTFLHFVFTEKSDSYRKLTKDKRVTHGGSLTFDMNTMTDYLPPSSSSSEVCT